MTDNIDKKYHGPNGKFQPGNPGRPVGSVNGTRKAIKDFLAEQSANLPKWFASLDTDRDRLEYFIRLCAYGVPRLQAVSFADEEGKTITDFDIDKLSDEDLRELIRIQQKASL